MCLRFDEEDEDFFDFFFFFFCGSGLESAGLDSSLELAAALDFFLFRLFFFLDLTAGLEPEELLSESELLLELLEVDEADQDRLRFFTLSGFSLSKTEQCESYSIGMR